MVFDEKENYLLTVYTSTNIGILAWQGKVSSSYKIFSKVNHYIAKHIRYALGYIYYAEG
jgi:hypothetical protein